MDPLVIIIWSCVIVFIITALLTLLHVSGIYQLPNPEHGKILFKALIVEIVVISIGAFGSYITNQSGVYTGIGKSSETPPSILWENKVELLDGIEGGCVYFENDSSSIFPNSLPDVAKENIKLKLEMMTFGKILITGYGDAGNPDNYSAHVGTQRARRVADYLISIGASPVDIITMASAKFERNLYVHPFVCGAVVNRQ